MSKSSFYQKLIHYCLCLCGEDMANSIAVTSVHQNVTAQNDLEILAKIPVPVLAKELETYKISYQILTYLGIPIVVWGIFGNFFSFRLVSENSNIAMR